MDKPQVNFSRLGVSYWRVAEPWADPHAVVTIDDATIVYSTTCDWASFPYKQHWESSGYLEVLPVWKDKWCRRARSRPFLRFYFFLRQSDSAKSSEPFVTLGQSLEVQPYIRLRRFEPAGLESRRWIISEYLDDGRLVTPDLHYPPREGQQGLAGTTPPPTITFDHGALEGSPSCGALMGDYTLAGQSLTLQASLFLRGWCPPTLLRQNDRVLAALRRVTRFQPSGVLMLLRGAKGEVEAVLTPAWR